MSFRRKTILVLIGVLISTVATSSLTAAKKQKRRAAQLPPGAIEWKEYYTQIDPARGAFYDRHPEFDRPIPIHPASTDTATVLHRQAIQEHMAEMERKYPLPPGWQNAKRWKFVTEPNGDIHRWPIFGE